MGLTSGAKLGHFEVTGLLGKGGMGEVYRARDTKLGRDVAIKILPSDFARDTERLQRFDREAEILAALDHPNIGALYDFQNIDGLRFFVLQLVEGESLQQRIDRGAIPLREVLPIFIQIAEALESAHAKNIVHRDLKPGNIQLTADGVVKVLDFGLARPLAREPRPPLSPTDSTRAPDPNRVTTDGSILGTPSYMSPEQARGKEIDKRTDIWAFGCCLYEALTGRQPFRGDTVSDTLAQVLEREPDWDALPADTPWRIRELLERCLEKDPRLRLRDIGDAWSDLKKLTTDSGRISPEAAITEGPRRRRQSIALLGMAASLIVVAVAAWSLSSVLNPPQELSEVAGIPAAPQPRVLPPQLKRFQIDIGQTAPLNVLNVSAEVAISRDGKRIAYTASKDGVKRLYVHDMRQGRSMALPNTEEAWAPFFSPDGEWIAYIVPLPTTGKLMKIAVSGGAPQVLCDAFPPTPGAWLDDGTIVFAGQDSDLDLSVNPYRSHLFRVHENGGTPERLTKADGMATGEWIHNSPQRIPGANKILFTIHKALKPHIALLDLDTGKYDKVLDNAHGAQYATSGHLVFARDNALWASPFDPATGSIQGREVIIQGDVQMNSDLYIAPFAVSEDGSFVYLPAVPPLIAQRTIVWVDHMGREETVTAPPRAYWWPRVSPDGTRVATVILPSEESEKDHIWIHEFDRAQSLRRLTFDPEGDGTPMWSPTGRNLFFVSERLTPGENRIFSRRADGTGKVNALAERIPAGYLADITPDGSAFIVGSLGTEQTWDICTIRVANAHGDGNSEAPDAISLQPLIATPFHEGNPKLSPDGKWIAYGADEIGSQNLFVRPYPNVEDGRWTISTDGGFNVTWSPDGTEIYFRNENRMMAVRVTTEPAFRAQTPRILFEGDYVIAPDKSRQYDIEYPDGNRFLMLKNLPDMRTTKLAYVTNWFKELNRLAPHTKDD